MKLHLTISIFITMLLSSCDCMVDENGMVLDGATGLPLEDVTITYNKRIFKTAADGSFKIKYVTGFCPDRHFIFEKEHYRPMELKIDYDDDQFTYSVMAKSDFVEYKEPRYLDSLKRSTVVGEWVELSSRNFSIRNDTLTIFMDAGK